MKNLKISLKLTIGFGLILIMFLASVVFASLNLQSIADDLDQFYKRPFTNVALAIQSDMDSEVVAKYMLRACLEVGVEETEEMLDKSEEYLDDMRDNLAQLKENYSGDKNDVTIVEKQVDSLESAYEEYAAAARANDVTGAYKIYTDKIVELLTDITKSVDTLTTQASNFAKESHDEGMAASETTIFTMVLIGVVAVVVGIILAFYITHMIRSAVTQLEKAAENMKEGNFEADIAYHSKDELGLLSDAMRGTMEILQMVIKDIGYQMNELADGNLAVKTHAEESYVGDLKPILTAIQKMKKDLNHTMSGIAASADQVNAGADQIAAASQALAQGATEQAASVEELVATIDGISQQVSVTAEHAETAKERNMRSHDELQTCSGHMNNLVGAMKIIEEKSNEVSKVIKAIEDIAFQTNILALNAAVEAARAGSAGKGFAVVADEVRNLASKSDIEAKNTTALIEEAIRAVGDGTKLSAETNESLSKVMEDAKAVLEAVTNISDATMQQSEAIKEVTVGVDQISSVVQTNSATAEQSAASSEELSSQSQVLKQMVSAFTLDTGTGFADTDDFFDNMVPQSDFYSSDDKY